MTRRLLWSSSPSSLARIWLTTPSRAAPPKLPSPVAPPPRFRSMLSHSSRTTTWSDDCEPIRAHSSSAGLKIPRTACSDAPRRCENTSGPRTRIGLRSLRSLAMPRAISVLPVPGGPCRSRPRAWRSPQRSRVSRDTSRDVRTRRMTASSSRPNPPTPSAAPKSPLASRMARRCFSATLRLLESAARPNRAAAARAAGGIIPGAVFGTLGCTRLASSILAVLLCLNNQD
mmetsp:Transcript_12242/g.32285  ORF Transcript_12242/g.32285 Transcript_12242/m.32285 type:complete len:229 (+) Transcript_12242:881-1567(+)